MSKDLAGEGLELPTILAFTPRDRARALVRGAFPKRKWRVITATDATGFRDAMRRTFVDAALVDVGAHGAATMAGGDSAATSPNAAVFAAQAGDTWKIAALAQEFPSAPFFGITPLRATDAPAVARCETLEFVDVITDGIDDDVARQLVAPRTFSARFAAALAEPPASLALRTAMQLDTWRCVLRFAGRPIRTARLAREVGVSREHLSRHFSTPGGPNLKRVIDLVRMISAAELAKNPGLDIRDVARILGFASSSHLAVTAQRVLGTRPASLSRLRTIDLIERFTQGRTRSRG
ncbi:MAG: helix-turn-helix domain-containing protein [Gemmatimonadaceae bacterium]|nr:helix-turn-helix domain-containing protein [Gemmatimonadaceae bacterium]